MGWLSAPGPEHWADSAGPAAAGEGRQVLVAGIGNVRQGDDAFGVFVARRLALHPLPSWARVADFGTCGIRLVHELIDRRYATTILVEASPRGEAPGTLCVTEPDPGAPHWLAAAEEGVSAGLSAGPDRVISWIRRLGGDPGRVLVVGCEPSSTAFEKGLSEPVRRAVDSAVGLLLELLEREDDLRRAKRRA